MFTKKNVCKIINVFANIIIFPLFFFFLFQCIDAARDVLDTELTARAGESYNRAYGV